MTYSGDSKLRPGQRPFTQVETVLGVATEIATVTGRPLKHKALTAAATASERIAELRAACADWPQTAAENLRRAGIEYAEGKTTAAAVAAQAAAVAAASGTASEMQRLAEQSTAGINRRALEDVAAMGEAAWLAPLKAKADDLLSAANKLADDINHEPPPVRVGTRSLANPWAPSRQDLEDITLRHNWENLGHVLSELDEVHSYADLLRNVGVVACVPGRVFSEDYRWKHADQLDGEPADQREFFLANRHDGEPGLYSAAALADANPPTRSEAGIVAGVAAALHGELTAAPS